MGAGDSHSEGCREMWGNVIPVLKWREVVMCWSGLAWPVKLQGMRGLSAVAPPLARTPSLPWIFW